MLLTALIACTLDAPLPAPEALPDDGERVTLPGLSFDAWDDVIAMQAGADADCSFLAPATADDTTRFEPLQTFWVIHDAAEDVETEGFYDVFFAGDTVTTADFADRNGKRPLGLAPISAWTQSMLPLEAMYVDGSFLSAQLAGSLGVQLEVELERTRNGCTPRPIACLEPCEGDWVELSAIHLELGPLGGIEAMTLQ